MEDPNGHTTSFTYDDQGNLAKATPPDPRGETSYTYDELGRPITTTDGRGVTVNFTYDGHDRPVKTTPRPCSPTPPKATSNRTRTRQARRPTTTTSSTTSPMTTSPVFTPLAQRSTALVSSRPPRLPTATPAVAKLPPTAHNGTSPQSSCPAYPSPPAPTCTAAPGLVHRSAPSSPLPDRHVTATPAARMQHEVTAPQPVRKEPAKSDHTTAPRGTSV
ncbi:hypothetical protein [Streptomyces sp. NPDC102360]|uniref:RHS repeat domain-containing protein n=1 Tax=Streptomyces sp. NPDC102360 TaxID=3366160 RepID=UPI0038244C14